MYVVLKKIVFFACFFCLFLLLEIIPFLERNFPLNNPEAVLFTLSQNMQGSQSFVLEMLASTFLKTFAYSGIVFFICNFVCLVAKKKRVKIRRNLVELSMMFVLSVICIKQFFFSIPFVQYINAYTRALCNPKSSPLYENFYVDPESVAVVFPEKKKNLIWIFMESMETNFGDSLNGGSLAENRIPYITKMMQENDSFFPGGISVAGTNWTIAGIVSQTCGIPINFPVGISANVVGVRNYLPGAKCLTDYLKENSYNMVFDIGSSAGFMSKNHFFTSHGLDSIHDYLYFEREQLFSKEDYKFWGIPDNKLYELAKVDLQKLANQDNPFAMILLTVDTHTPYGYIDSSCSLYDKNVPEERQYPFVISCADEMLRRFIEWSKQQSWYENTLIVVTGDHPTMAAGDVVGYLGKKEKRTINFIMNSEIHSMKNERTFSSFDMYPTIMEALGAKIENHKLSFGVSLFSQNSTLLEKIKRTSLDSLLLQRSLQYEKIMYGN